jgi:hypothetical protein
MDVSLLKCSQINKEIHIILNFFQILLISDTIENLHFTARFCKVSTICGTCT